MAEMTNDEFKAKLNKLEANKLPSVFEVQPLKEKLEKIDNLDEFDSEALDKLEKLIDANDFIKVSGLSPTVYHTLKTKINERREQLKTLQVSTLAPNDGNAATLDNNADKADTVDAPDAGKDTPADDAAKANTDEVVTEAATNAAPDGTKRDNPENADFSEFDAMSSYNLLQQYKDTAAKIAELSSEDAEAHADEIRSLSQRKKAIADYVKKEFFVPNSNESAFNLDEHNAPIVRDYVDILIGEDPEYSYDKKEELEQKLAEYDKLNGLDGELPTPEERDNNENRWAELTKDYGYELAPELEEDSMIKVLKKENPEIVKTLRETLRITALTQLSLEAPDEDAQKAKARYQEKIEELSAQYLGNVKTNFSIILNDQLKWRKQFAKDEGLDAQKLQEIENDPAQKKLYDQKFQAYLASNLCNAANCSFAEKNAIYGSRLARKIGMAQTPERAEQLKEEAVKKEPIVMTMLKEGAKNSAWSIGVVLTTGILGLTVRQTWKMCGAYKSAWKNYKSQNDGQGNFRGFFKYLYNNKEEMSNIATQTVLWATSAAFTGVMAATGTLAFGAVGSALGIGTQVAANAAAQTTILGLSRLQAVGAISAIAGLGQYFHNRQTNAKNKKELMEIMQKYLPQQDQPEAPVKGFFGKLFHKSPQKRIMNDLTKMNYFRNNDDEVYAKLDEYMPNMSPEDRQKAFDLIDRIKTAKAKSGAALIGASVGGIMAGNDAVQNNIGDGVQTLKNSIGLGTENTETLAEVNPEGNTETPSGNVNYDINKSPVENLEDGEFKPINPIGNEADDQEIQVPYRPGEQPEEITETGAQPEENADPQPEVTTHTFEVTASKVTEQPNATYVILKDMGLMDGKDFDELRGGNTHITQTPMTNYLSKLELTDAQQQEFQARLDSGEFDQIAEKLKDGRMVIRPGGEVVERSHGWLNHTASHDTPTNGSDANAPQGDSAGGETEGKGETEGEGEGKGDVEPKKEGNEKTTEAAAQKKIVEIKGKGESGSWLQRALGKKDEVVVQVAAKEGNINVEAENYARAIACHDKGISQDELGKFHSTGHFVGSDGKTHDFDIKVDKNGNMTRIVDGVKTRIYHNGDTSVGVYKNNMVDANTVGDEVSQAKDRVLGKIHHSDTKTSTTYIQDGETKDVYEKVVKGGETTVNKTELTVKEVKNILKQERRA